ncbi:MAG TPA: DUF2993 domain-containing protein [Acidimicrobiales bacterium]|nr:DUF2993 domain-containing protein [Acidimicrobiales bacterium]
MIRRLFFLGVVATLAVLGDVAARGFVESAVNARAEREAPPDSNVSATIDGFPFLPKLILGSEVSHVGVHLENIAAQDVLVFGEVEIDLDGVRFDRSRLINDRKARITAIDHGTVTATITEDALSKALRGAPVSISQGAITVAGISVVPTIKDGRLSIGAFAIPATEYLPCASTVEVNEGRMEVSCEIDDVPPMLLDAVQDAIDP